jgi:hypothetical protein
MIIPSFFGEYAEQPVVQAMIDDSLDNLQGQSLWRTYLDIDMPQASLTFETAIGRDRIEAAASIVDIDSPAPLRGRNVLELYGGKIPTMKQKFVLSQSELRQLMALEESQLLNGNGAVTALIAKLYNDVEKAAVAGDRRVDIMLLQALSQLSVDTSLSLNPDGAAYGVINLLPKAYQIQGVPVTWIANPTTATPIDDIENFIEYITVNFGRSFGKIMMSQTMWLQFRRMSQVIARIQTFFNVGKANASFAVTISNVNDYFAANGWPPIEVINVVRGVEQDGIITPFRPFAENNISFVPDGKLGMLKNAFPMERKRPIAGKTYADFGPTLVMKWADDDPYREYTGMEMNAFPAIDIDSVFVLTTNVQQTSFTGGTISA